MHEWIDCDGCAVFQSSFMMKTMGKVIKPTLSSMQPFLVLHKSSFVSVVFDFNASFNDVAPVSQKLFTVNLMRMDKSGLLMDAICVLFLLCSHHRLSSVSVVFDFNASLNDVAPFSPILLPVDLMRMEKSGLLMDVICVLFLLSSLLILS